MTDDLAEVCRHVAAAHALLEGIATADVQGETATTGARMGVQIDAAGMAELVELAARLRLTPAQTLRLALRALAVELEKAKPARVGRLVGKERGLLEAKR
jgi:hypothetical protein